MSVSGFHSDQKRWVTVGANYVSDSSPEYWPDDRDIHPCGWDTQPQENGSGKLSFDWREDPCGYHEQPSEEGNEPDDVTHYPSPLSGVDQPQHNNATHNNTRSCNHHNTTPQRQEEAYHSIGHQCSKGWGKDIHTRRRDRRESIGRRPCQVSREADSLIPYTLGLQYIEINIICF